MYDLDDASGPDIDDRVRESLKRWGFASLTAVQYAALVAGAATGRSLVVCAPTSSGKTLIGEICVLQALHGGYRCLYLVSHKALADQKYADFVTRFSSAGADPSATVALSTGDREEGDLQADILVATYEKALVLILSGQIDATATAVVADELQIIGEPTRGPNIETLCAILRQRGTLQLLALTATVENPSDLAAWLRCDLVQNHERDVELVQEIWYDGRGYSVIFGQEEGSSIDTARTLPSETLSAVNYLLELGRGPILVFTESRREASQYAASFAQRRQRHASGIVVAEQLSLFSEPTEGSNSLQTSAERRIASHTADLTSQERQVIEQGFIDGSFDVCFATSTLAAGVNFPFKTVLFSKLTYAYGNRQGTRITRNDYRNMSGRAGRLGLHDSGHSVLLPRNAPERSYANRLVLPENDRIDSQLAQLSMRRTVLVLLAAGVASTMQQLKTFFENTYYWHRILEQNPAQLAALVKPATEAVTWLVGAKFLEHHDDSYVVTPLGQATARSGLLPMTAEAFVVLLDEHRPDLETKFNEILGGLIHWICSSREFAEETASRFLPYPLGGTTPSSATFVAGQKLFIPLDRANSQLCQCVHAMILFLEGVAERKIFRFTGISSGNVHRLALDLSWMLDGLHGIAAVPDLRCPQQVGNQLGMLARRVRWGAPAEALDIIRVAERARVPGFGRQRTMKVLESGATTFEDIENLGVDGLADIVQSRRRAEALLTAIGEHTSVDPSRFSLVHGKLATRLGIAEILKACSTAMDKDYEDSIVRLLREESEWVVTVLDDERRQSVRQNVPDVMLALNGTVALLEMKTASKRSGCVKKEEAFAVLQKAADFDRGMARVTLGKPRFDETSKVKAMASSEITLVEHASFVEGMLRVLGKEIAPEAFLAWLVQTGEAEFARLPGRPTHWLI